MGGILQEYSSQWALWTDGLEVLKCVRSPLSTWHGGGHWSPGTSSCGCWNRLTLTSSSTQALHSSSPPPPIGLTLVVYQWLVGTFDNLMVDFLIGHYTHRMFPPDTPPPPSGELVFCFCGLAGGNRKTEVHYGYTGGSDSSIFYSCIFR